MPRLQEKGTIDLYLSRPGRAGAAPPLALLRRAAARRREPALPHRLDLADRHLEDARRCTRASSWAGVVILFTIAALLAFAFLVGVVTSSTAVSLMATYAVFFFAAMLAAHEKIAAAVSAEWAREARPRPLLDLPEDGGARARRRSSSSPAADVHRIAVPDSLRRLRLDGALRSSPLWLSPAWLFSRKDF